MANDRDVLLLGPTQALATWREDASAETFRDVVGHGRRTVHPSHHITPGSVWTRAVMWGRVPRCSGGVFFKGCAPDAAATPGNMFEDTYEKNTVVSSVRSRCVGSVLHAARRVGGGDMTYGLSVRVKHKRQGRDTVASARALDRTDEVTPTTCCTHAERDPNAAGIRALVAGGFRSAWGPVVRRLGRSVASGVKNLKR
jgi:hypothetical protein